jgi:hypothetical protein
LDANPTVANDSLICPNGSGNRQPETGSAVATLVIAYTVGGAAALWFSRAAADAPVTATEPTA